MIVEDIKRAQISARKARDSFKTGVLTTLLGEVEKIGKDAGNRKTTDEESIRVIKKFVKNINETLKLTDRNNTALNQELEVLSEFLPDEISDEDLRNQIVIIINEMKMDESNPKIVIGPVMKILKSRVDNFDGKTASTIIREEIK